MALAVYVGTFDPPTKGHEDITLRASRMFEKVVVGVFDTPAKTLLFSTKERVEMLQGAICDIPNAEVLPYSGLTVEFAHLIGASAIVRGLRSITDLDYEIAMAMMNRKLYPHIDTIFLYTSLEYQFVSSTLIKEVARYKGDIINLVSKHIAIALQEKYHKDM